MTAEELAIAFIEQLHANREGEFSPLLVWERLITTDPERAWPVFEHA